MDAKLTQQKGKTLSKTVSELISCPNNDWRLFQRDGVFYADGRRNRLGKHSLNTRNRSDAIRLVIELDGRAGRDEARPSVDTGSASASVPVAIPAGWDRYIECRKIPIHLGGLKNSSIRKYRTHQKRFAAYCQNKRIECWSGVTRGVLEAYATSLDGKLAPVTVHDDLTMEISVSNWLVKEGLIPQTCSINWRLQKPPGAEQYCYDLEEVRRMLEIAKALKVNRWLYATIFLLSHTGMRIGEAQHLKWSDIDFKNEVLHIRDESFSKKLSAERRMVKGKKSRIVPMHGCLLEFLREHRRSSGFVLMGDRGSQLNYNHVLKAFTKHIIATLDAEFPTPDSELGFKDGRLHSFRHFFVSECFAAGNPESDIRLWVGHSDSKILALYRHIRNDVAKSNIRRADFGAA